jgi:ribulose-5-phosphate 4-epimerase/fuculose-1-phosphate aldolase
VRYNVTVSYQPAEAEGAAELALLSCRALAAAGQGDMIWGHPSVRDPQDRGVWMKSAGWGLEEIDASKIVLVSPDGEILEGTGPRHLEFHIHTQIMALRPDVGSVVHTHSPAANQLSALDVPLRPLDHAGSLFCYPDVPRFTMTGGLIKTRSLGAELARTLGAARACLMPQHGLVAVGPDAPSAIMTAVLLDRACQTQLAAMSAGPLGHRAGHHRQTRRGLGGQPDPGRLGVPDPPRLLSRAGTAPVRTVPVRTAPVRTAPVRTTQGRRGPGSPGVPLRRGREHAGPG